MAWCIDIINLPRIKFSFRTFCNIVPLFQGNVCLISGREVVFYSVIGAQNLRFLP